MTRYRLLLFLTLLLFLSPLLRAQNFDSLRKAAGLLHDSAKTDALVVLAEKYKFTDTAKAFPLYREALSTAIGLHYTKGIVRAICSQSRRVSQVSGSGDGVAFLNRALTYIDTNRADNNYGNYLITMGSLFADGGEYASAIDAYFKALKIYDKTKDTIGMARSNHGLGFAYQRLNKYDEVETYYEKAYELYKSKNDLANSATMTANLGGAFLGKAMGTKEKKDFDKALAYFNQAIDLLNQTGDKTTLPTVYNNLGSLYGAQENYEQSLRYFRYALAIRRELGYQFGTATTLNNLSQCYTLVGKIDSAIICVDEAYTIARSIGARQVVASSYACYADIYEAKKDFKNAFEYYRRYKLLSDSLIIDDNLRSLSDAQEKYKSVKQQKNIELLEQAQKSNEAIIAKQEVINYIIIAGLILIAIFSLFVYREYSAKKKANAQLSMQNQVIQEKNRDITDSIQYAQTIQRALMPDEAEFSSHFRGGFVLYKPKDIVSGDFYWVTEKNNCVFFAIADCTGHGVPGGFMSMLGTSLLNEIVNERGIEAPADILEILRDKIIVSLHQRGEAGESKDGLDITLCRLDRKTLVLEYACAFNAFFVVRKGSEPSKKELLVSEADRMPVGFHHSSQPFTGHRMQLETGDLLYASTDGYVDQFGGEQRKKFKTPRLKELLLSISDLPLAEQKRRLDETLEAWKNGMEQTDDICLAGIVI